MTVERLEVPPPVEPDAFVLRLTRREARMLRVMDTIFPHAGDDDTEPFGSEEDITKEGMRKFFHDLDNALDLAGAGY